MTNEIDDIVKEIRSNLTTEDAEKQEKFGHILELLKEELTSELEEWKSNVSTTVMNINNLHSRCIQKLPDSFKNQPINDIVELCLMSNIADDSSFSEQWISIKVSEEVFKSKSNMANSVGKLNTQGSASKSHMFRSVDKENDQRSNTKEFPKAKELINSAKKFQAPMSASKQILTPSKVLNKPNFRLLLKNKAPRPARKNENINTIAVSDDGSPLIIPNNNNKF